MTKAQFVPQAWVNDYAIEVDAEGPTEFEIEPLTQEQIDALDADTYTRDELRFHPNAPAWIGEWTGPFEIYVFND